MHPTFDFSDLDALERAREMVMARRADGVECPCCGQFAKTYKRKLNSQMAHFLVRLALLDAANPGASFSTREIVGGAHKASSDGTYLVLWGMIRQGESHGCWRITAYGREFAYGRTDAARHVSIFANQVVKVHDDERTTIHVAAGDAFDYWELMRGGV